jgi:hypothetical protein
MTRSTVALVAATAVFSSSATIGAQQLTSPSSADATPSTDRATLNELKKLNASIGSISRSQTVVGLLYDTKNGVLKDICRNTRPDGSFPSC